MIDWELVLTKGIEVTPATAAVLIATWAVWSCSILLRRTFQFVAGRTRTSAPPRPPQPQVRREPTFPPSVRSRGSAELDQVIATVEALQSRVAALEEHLQAPTRLSAQPATKVREADRTVVPLDWAAASKRRIDLG